MRSGVMKSTGGLLRSVLPWVLSAFVAFCLSTFVGYRAHSQIAEFKRLTPFIVFKHMTQFAEDPKFPPWLLDTSYARRSDGSWSYRYTAHGPQGKGPTVSPAEMVYIADFVKRRKVTLEPFTRSALVFPLDEKALLSERARVPGCLAIPEADLRRGAAEFPTLQVMSRPVIHVVTRDDYVVIEHWVDRSLDCFPLQEREKFRSGSHNETIAYRIETREPNDSLFEIPPDFTERSPRQLDEQYVLLFGVPFWTEPAASNVERQYERSRAVRR